MSSTRAAALVRDGIASAKAGDLARARSSLHQALTLDPDNSTAWLWVAGVATDPVAGVRALERVLQLDPGNERAKAGLKVGRFEAGVALAKARRRVEARDLLWQACQDDSANEAALLWLAAATDDPAEAAGCLERALKLNPNNDRALAGLAHFRALAGTAWTCPICRSESAGPPESCPNCRAILDLGQADRAIGNPNPDAVKIRAGVARLAAEVRAKPDFHAFYHLGMALLNLGRPDDAVPHFRAARRLRPNDVNLGTHLGLLEQALADAAPATQKITRADLAAMRASPSRSVLVVDDSPTIRKLVSLTMQRSGFRVVEAADGHEALEAIATEGNPDLIVTDVIMPGMDGFTFCRALRDNPATAGVPVIVLTARDGFMDRMRGKMAGTSQYLTKPFQPDALVRAVREFYPAAAG